MRALVYFRELSAGAHGGQHPVVYKCALVINKEKDVSSISLSL